MQCVQQKKKVKSESIALFFFSLSSFFHMRALAALGAAGLATGMALGRRAVRSAARASMAAVPLPPPKKVREKERAANSVLVHPAQSIFSILSLSVFL